MPITVQHAPNLGIIADAALFAGQGEFLDRQQQQQRRDAALAQQAFQNERELQARLYMQAQAQAANQNSQLFQAARQNALMQQQREQQLADMGQQRQWREADLGQQRQWNVADAQQANQWNNERFDRGQQAAWETQSVGALESNVSKQLADMAAKRDQFASKEDADAFDSIYAQWKAVQGNAMLRSSPAAYREGIAKFQEQLAEPYDLNNPEGQLRGIISRMKPPPDVQERFDKSVAYDKEGNAWAEDRNGKFNLRAGDSFDEFFDKNIGKFVTPDGEIDENAAIRAWRKKQAAKNIMQRESEVLAGGGSADDYLMASGAFDSPEPPPKPTRKTAKTADELWVAFDADERRKWLAEAHKILPKRKDDQQNEVPTSPEELIKAAKSLAAASEGVSSPVAQPAAEPEKPSLFGRIFGSGSPPAQATTGPPPKKPILPNHINEVPEALREKYRASLVQASSPAQAATFDPGTIFITPDGSIRMVPSAQ